jgi:ATP-dependent helicase/nuclease subunit B
VVTAGAYQTDVMGRVQAVPYGRAAVEVLAGQVRALKGGDPLAPVTVVVASNYAAIAARRALAAQPGGIANVTFLTLHRLAEQLGASRLNNAGRRPVSAPVVAAVVRAALDTDPGVFRAVASHAATEAALVRAHRELSACPDAALDAIARDGSPKGRDVVRIHRAVKATLSNEWYDEADLLTAATDALAAGRAPDLGPVIVHLLQEISAAGAALLQALAPEHVNVGITGVADADAAVRAAHERAGAPLPHEPNDITPKHATRALNASDADDEVRAAVRQLTEWMHEGVNLGRIAVLYGLPDPYARLLHEQLAAAGIPFNGTPVRALGDQLVGRTLRAMLDLPAGDFRRTDVLAVLTGAPLLDTDGRRIPSRAWERTSRDAGVVKGDHWRERLPALAQRNRDEARQHRIDDEDWRAERLEREADRADALARYVARLQEDLAAGAEARTWKALAEWALGLVATYFGDDAARWHWPEEEQLGAQRVEAAIERLAHLDALDGPAPTLAVFRRALDGELDQNLRRVGRLGEGVLVGHVSLAAGLVLDRVLVLGLAEGAFPTRRLEDSLLPDAERELAGGELALRRNGVHDDHRHLLAALSAADEAVLTRPRGDLRRSGERPASRWFTAYGGHNDEDTVASFTGGLRTVVTPSAEHELRLAAVARNRTDHPALAHDEHVTAGVELIKARRSDAFTRFDGNLAGFDPDLLRPTRASASRLQTWATCPHAYFMRYVLGVDAVEEPADIFEIDAASRGTLIHAALEDLVHNVLTIQRDLHAWTPDDRRDLTAIAWRWFDEFQHQGLTGRELLWRRDQVRILRELDEILGQDNVRLAAGWRPVATEERFTGVPVTLPSGHELHLNGSIDRVDRRPDGSLAVLDYKTGSKDSFTDLSPDRPHGHGTKLQLWVYAVAAEHTHQTGRPVTAGYWFTRDGAIVGYDVTPEVAERVTEAVDHIVESIAAGVFPARPADPPKWGYVDCDYCRPDGLAATDRRREWERKRVDPALVAYATFCGEVTVDDA